MRHKWDDGLTFMDAVVSTCQVCGATRWRKRIDGVDYIQAPGIHIDLVGQTRKGWRYERGQRSCPGQPSPVSVP